MTKRIRLSGEVLEEEQRWDLIAAYMTKFAQKLLELEGQVGKGDPSGTYSTLSAGVTAAIEECSELEAKLTAELVPRLNTVDARATAAEVAAQTATSMVTQLSSNGVDVNRAVTAVEQRFHTRFAGYDDTTRRMGELENEVVLLRQYLTEVQSCWVPIYC